MRMAPQTGIGGTVGALYTRAVFQASSRPRTVCAREVGHREPGTGPDGNGLFVDWRQKGLYQGGAWWSELLNVGKADCARPAILSRSSVCPPRESEDEQWGE